MSKNVKITFITYYSECHEGKRQVINLDIEGKSIMNVYDRLIELCGIREIHNVRYNYFRIIVDGEEKEARLEFSFEKFLENHNINKDKIEVLYSEFYGIGGGACISDLAKIRINSSESEHINSPHVHVMKVGKSSPEYRVDLETFRELDNDKIKWNHDFTRKEWNKIINIIKLNCEALRDCYISYQKGEQVGPFYIKAGDEEVEFH